MTIENVTYFESRAESNTSLGSSCTPRALDVLLKNHSVPDYIYSNFREAFDANKGLAESLTWAGYLLDEFWAGLRTEPFGLEFYIDSELEQAEQKRDFLELLSTARESNWLLLLVDPDDNDHMLGGLRSSHEPGKWDVIGQVVLGAYGEVLVGWNHPGDECLPGDLTNIVTIDENRLWESYASKLSAEVQQVNVITILPPESSMASELLH